MDSRLVTRYKSSALDLSVETLVDYRFAELGIFYATPVIERRGGGRFWRSAGVRLSGGRVDGSVRWA